MAYPHGQMERQYILHTRRYHGDRKYRRVGAVAEELRVPAARTGPSEKIISSGAY